MANFNQVILLGRLTRDVELRTTQGGTALAKFGMAMNRKWTQNGEQKESTCFVDLTAWGRQAEVLSQYVKKGSELFVQGRLDFQQWEDKETKQKRSAMQVIVENFQFVGSARGAGAGAAGGAGGAASGGASGEEGAPRRSGGGKQAGGEQAQGGNDVDYGDIPF